MLIVVGSSPVLALSTAWSVGNTDEIGAIMTAGLDYLPAELVFAGLALALFGLWPRGFGLTWAAYAAATFIALLGPGLKLAQWVLDLAPTTHVGNPPLGTVDAGNLAALAIVAIALAAGRVHRLPPSGRTTRLADPCGPRRGRAQAMAFDQGRSFKSPFTRDLVTARVDLERHHPGTRCRSRGDRLHHDLVHRYPREHVPPFYPLTFALTEPQVVQANRCGLSKCER